MIPVLILIAVLIVWLATTYDTVGIILTVAGGVLVALQVVLLVIGASAVASRAREAQRSFRDF